MRFSLATNFDDALIEQVRGIPVAEIFGKLPQDATGGGRASYQVEVVGARCVQQVIEADPGCARGIGPSGNPQAARLDRADRRGVGHGVVAVPRCAS